MTSLKRLYRVPASRLGDPERETHKSALTLVPHGGEDMRPLTLWWEHRGDLFVPRFYGERVWGVATRDHLHNGDAAPNLVFEGSLDPGRRQIEAAAAIAHAFGRGHGGTLHLSCGMGKTSVALWAAAHYNRRTMVLVHKEFLMNQWRERIAQFLPHATVGRVQGPIVETDADIVLAMMQSVSMKEYPPGTFDGFGLCIIDEAHRVCARTFSKCLRQVGTRVILGLSATPTRKDGFDQVLDLFVGPRLFSAVRESERVEVVRHIMDYSGCTPLEITYNNGRVGIAKMLTWLTTRHSRNRLIQRLISDETNEGRRVLLLSERREHLETMMAWCASNGMSAGMYRGGMKRSALEASEQCQVVLGTYAMSSEGLDIAGLNTLILATPRSDIEQAVGRVQRDPNPAMPVRVYDIVDPYSVFQGQSFKRLQWFKSKRYRLRVVDHRPQPDPGSDITVDWADMETEADPPDPTPVRGAPVPSGVSMFR